MTLPNERTRAVVELAREVQALAPYLHGSTETVRVPRETLRRLYGWLRHYPTPLDMATTAKLASRLWAATPCTTTTEPTITHNPMHTTEPLALKSNEGLGSLPEDALRQQAFVILSRLQSGTEDVVRLDAALAAVTAERERIGAALLKMHERDGHRHNYWLCAWRELYGA
jgi:hypothetical protein